MNSFSPRLKQKICTTLETCSSKRALLASSGTKQLALNDSSPQEHITEDAIAMHRIAGTNARKLTKRAILKADVIKLWWLQTLKGNLLLPGYASHRRLSYVLLQRRCFEPSGCFSSSSFFYPCQRNCPNWESASTLSFRLEAKKTSQTKLCLLACNSTGDALEARSKMRMTDVNHVNLPAAKIQAK